jgi:UDP-glucose 4-epimerase
MTTPIDYIPGILVTGGAGFIGSHVVRSALAIEHLAAHRIVVLDDLSGGYRENVVDSDRVEFVHGSITNAALVERLFDAYRFEYVYHLAAYAAEGLSHFIRRFNYTNNLIGSVNLINQAVLHETKCFVFTSSIAVYGAAQVPMREDMTPVPEDPYGVAKYAVELDLWAAQRQFGLDSVIFRPHNVYGEYQNIADRYRNAVGIFMNQILSGQPMTIFGDGSQQRAFTYVGDIAPVIAGAPFVDAARNGVFNIGAETPYTVNEMAQLVARSLGCPDHPLQHLPARNEVYAAYCDQTRCREVFGRMDETGLEHGLVPMAAWVRKVGARQTKPFGEIEVWKNMPPSWAEDGRVQAEG